MKFGGVWTQQSHAVLAAGNEDRLEIEVEHECKALLNQLLLVSTRADDRLELEQIRGNQRRASVLFEVAAFWVHNHRLAFCPRGSDETRYILQRTLRIVRNDNHLRVVEHRLEASGEVGDVGSIELLLEIHTQQLLMLANHAKFGNRGLVGRL